MKKIKSINPANEKVIGEVECSSQDEIKKKVEKAQEAFENWGNLDIKFRVKELKKLFNILKENKENLASLATAEMGMPIKNSLSDIDDGLSFFDWYLENSEKFLFPEITFEDKISTHKVYYEPIGVAAVIVPWNFPFSNFIWGVIPNLIVGNTVVFKCSEETVLYGKLIDKMVRKAKLPNGVFNQIFGDGEEGDYLVSQDINLIWFTGSSKVGKNLYKIGASKFIKVLLELGGSSAGIVFEDCDINKVSDSIFFGRFFNCGQVCDGLKRLIVHKNKFQEVVSKLKKRAEELVVGDPSKKETQMGALVSKKQLNILIRQVNNAINLKAKIVCGGEKIDNLKGYFYKPTILTNIKKDMKVWEEEVFGPVLPIVSFESDEEALKLANDTKYGLGAYIFSEDKKKSLEFAKKLKAGMIGINNSYYLKPCNPFGGYKESGMGREHGKYGLRELCQIKVVAEEK